MQNTAMEDIIGVYMVNFSNIEFQGNFTQSNAMHRPKWRIMKIKFPNLNKCPPLKLYGKPSDLSIIYLTLVQSMIYNAKKDEQPPIT